MSEAATVGLIFVPTAAVLLGLAIFFFVRTRRFLARAIDTHGTVVELVASRSSEGGTTYKPVVQFTTPEGGTFQFTDSMSSNPPGFDVGEAAPVKYDPKNPQRARIGTGFRLWFLVALFGGLGLIFAVVGLALLVAG
jgi:hypothetical protein